MIKVTPARANNEVRISEDNIVACKPQPSGETDIFFDNNIPLPRKPTSIVRKFRITESIDDLGDVGLKKYQTVSEGAYWYINKDKILSETETAKGVRVYLPSDVSEGNTPFSTQKLHLREVS